MSIAPEARAAPVRYRALIPVPDGRVVDTRESLTSADDDEAASLATAMVNGHAVVLCDGLRFIEHFDVVASRA